MKALKRTFISIACSLSFIATSQAATVTLNKGTGSVDRGSGFQPIVGPQTVGAGHRVMVNANSEATLNYDPDCPVKLEPGAVVTVLEISPCKGATLTTGAAPAAAAAAVPAAAATAGLSTGLVVGGLALAAGVGVLVASKSSPSSP